MVQTTEPARMKQADPYLEQFSRFEHENRPASWVLPLRKAGMARFAELGFPTTADEDWRFTNVSPIAKLPFRPVWELAAEAVSADLIQRLTFGRLPARRLVFVNGLYAEHLSAPGPAAPNLEAKSLRTVLAENPAALEPHLGRYAQFDRNAFAALNLAFFQDGAFVHVSKGAVIEEPIHLVFLSTGGQIGATAHPRNLIIVEAGSQATVIETYASTSNTVTLTNAVTEILAGDHARLEHLKFQDESLSAYHVAAIHARLGSGSDTILHSIALGAKLSRNNIRTSLSGEGLDCILNGLYLTRADQLADHHMVVEHAQPHCNSHEYYNGILDGRSKGVFHGRILVRQIAQKTDAKQTNKNLLLSEEATADTKPQLEIYADDVKCTHGATVGQLNEEAIFYLRARGIGLDTARRMLIHSFAGEIIERVRHQAAREELDRLVWDRLEANPHIGRKKPEPRT